MDARPGWIGSVWELESALRQFGCDAGPDGKFHVDGSIRSFMGAGEEFVVGADAMYYVNGEARRLVTALSATSYGRMVTVI